MDVGEESFWWVDRWALSGDHAARSCNALQLH